MRPSKRFSTQFYRFSQVTSVFKFSLAPRICNELRSYTIPRIPGVWSFASVVSLLIYCYAGLGMIFMQCSGVNSENSDAVNFDSMYSAEFPSARQERGTLRFFDRISLTQVFRDHCSVPNCHNIQLGHADVVKDLSLHRPHHELCIVIHDRSAIYNHGFKLWISLYFVTFYVLAVIVMCNLLIALIVVSACCGGGISKRNFLRCAI